MNNIEAFFTNNLLNNDSALLGIYRARIYDGDYVKVFGLCSGDSLDKISKQKAVWCAPNSLSTTYEDDDNVWVIFENGDAKRPVIVGFLGKSIKEAVTGYYGMYQTPPGITPPPNTPPGDVPPADYPRSPDSPITYEKLIEFLNMQEEKAPTWENKTECVDLIKYFVHYFTGYSYGELSGFGNGNVTAKQIITHSKCANMFKYVSDLQGLSNVNTKPLPGDVISFSPMHVVLVKSFNEATSTLQVIEYWGSVDDRLTHISNYSLDLNTGKTNKKYVLSHWSRPILYGEPISDKVSFTETIDGHSYSGAFTYNLKTLSVEGVTIEKMDGAAINDIVGTSIISEGDINAIREKLKTSDLLKDDIDKAQQKA